MFVFVGGGGEGGLEARLSQNSSGLLTLPPVVVGCICTYVMPIDVEDEIEELTLSNLQVIGGITIGLLQVLSNVQGSCGTQQPSSVGFKEMAETMRCTIHH